MNRRDPLKAAGAAGVAISGLSRALAEGPALRTPIDFDVPRGACDCHVRRPAYTF